MAALGSNDGAGVQRGRSSRRAQGGQPWRLLFLRGRKRVGLWLQSREMREGKGEFDFAG